MTDVAQVTEHVAAAAGAGVGEELASARAAQGLSIADIAQQLKFAARQIEAMEQGRFEDLPSGTFARGMVRSYARLLKLDAEQLVGRMAARVTVPDSAEAVASIRRPIPITDNSRRVNLIYAALSVAILGVSAAVVIEWQRERSDAVRLSLVPAARESQVPAELQRYAAATPVDVNPSKLAPLPGAEAAAPPRATHDKRRMVLKFQRSSWVEIRGRDGKILISQLNPGGSEQAVEGRPPFSLVIGNAQYVRLSYEDREIDLTPHVKVKVARFTLE
ncbi:MAG: helix-turn-helix domain-containing protein [Betaproteobacteria bacterium]|nr:helix-turn-helix domain-containing protein [Betaproteobacteria bacterium]